MRWRVVGRALCELWDTHRWNEAGGGLVYCARCGLLMHAPLTEEELEIISLLPIFLEGDVLPQELQGKAGLINGLAARGIIVFLSNGLGPRWGLSVPSNHAGVDRSTE